MASRKASNLFSAQQIRERVAQLGREISRDYRDRELLLIGILKGAVVFMADLARELTIPAAFDFMAVSSYGAATESSGVVRILKDLDLSLENRHVLIVEDIVDTGLTLHYLYEHLQARGPASLKICVLLDKPERRKIEVPVHYRGFQIPDHFVVGYGLDYDETYRNLPYIAVLNPEKTGGDGPGWQQLLSWGDLNLD